MATHLPEMMREHDEKVANALRMQITDQGNTRFGGYVLPGYHVDPRVCGFTLGDLLISYACKESIYYQDDKLRRAIDANFQYMRAHQRPDGCFDLSACNFASPPDTAFMCNHLFNAYWLLEQRETALTLPLKDALHALMVRCCEGIAAGGFHTPNHRWAIASCLLNAYKLTGRVDFKARAEAYLNEGLDINEDGEFAERSAGNYNQVNDDQMIRLFIATGEKRFLEASRSNLEMMLFYIEPDDSVFTNNSTRQDYGRKVYLETYYIFFLLTGYFLGDKRLGAIAEWVYSAARRKGMRPRGVEWLLLHADLDGYGADEPFEKTFLRYNRLFKASKIARMREDDISCTLMEDKANFLYFQHGSFVMYMVIYANLCDRRNFIAESIEPIQNGYRLRAHAEGWYYLPFYPDKPSSSDWWAMDNPHTRKRIQGVPLDTLVEVICADDGFDVRIKTEGTDQLPLRVEVGFEAGCKVRTPSFLLDGKAGESITLLSGQAEVTGPGGEVITLSPAFGEHNFMARSGGAYPQSPEHFTVYLTAYTPVDRVIHIGTTPFAKKDLL